jgi:alpha-beta hydrolase superfamily lysophospholipase
MKQSILLFSFLLFTIIAHGLKPNREYWRTPKDLGLQYEECPIKTVDGYTLNAWHIMPHENKIECTIIVSYGDAGNMASGLYLAAALIQDGFDVWLYDYRGFGKSDDFEMNLDQLYYTEFVDDLSVVVSKAIAANPKNTICLYGLSMGTIINTLYYHKHPDKVNFYVGEGLVYSPEDIVTRIKAMSEKKVSLPQSDTRLEQIYSNMIIPVLLFFASDDFACNNEDMAMLQQKIENMKVIAYEGGHAEGPMILGFQQYVQHITSFLNNQLDE